MKVQPFLLMTTLGLMWMYAAAQQAPNKRADIERLLELTQAQVLSQQLSQSMSAQMVNIVRASNPNVPEEMLTALSQSVDSVIEENLPSLLQELVGIYEKHYSHDDVRALLEFYSTAVGRRVIEAQPAISQESAIIGQSWGMSLRPQIQQRIQQSLQGGAP